MKSALQRELDALGWRAIGFAGGLIALAAAAVLWGTGIEGQLDDVERDRQQDRKVIRQLVAEAQIATPAPGPPASPGIPSAEPEVPSSPELGGGDVADDEDAPGSGPSWPPPSDPPTGSPAGSPPPPPAAEPPAAPPTSSPLPAAPAPSPGPIRSTLEQAGEGLGQVLCGVTDQLLQNCP